MARDSMTLEEVIRFTKQTLENVNPDKRVCTEFRLTVEQAKQLLEWLEDYKRLTSENQKLKELLKMAIDELEPLGSCGGSAYRPCEGCPYNANDGRCSSKWVHHDEAMKLLGGTDNAEN